MIILLAEDHPKQAELIKKIFEQEQYTVDVSNSGTEAWDKAQVRDYDLLVLDLDLPGMSGEELIKNIRDLSIQTPILVLTANDDGNSKVNNLDSGADDYLTKPFGVDELLARARALLRRPRFALPQKFVQGNLEIHYATREVLVGGKPLKLTRNEFRLLDFLARRPERVCTRSMIQEHVWGYDKELQSNVIEAVIYSLRKKLGGHKDLVETVQHIGYRFNTPSQVPATNMQLAA